MATKTNTTSTARRGKTESTKPKQARSARGAQAREKLKAAAMRVLEKVGYKFSGLSPDGELPEIVEISDHPWFIGVQFHPELKSKPFAPHPLFESFITAAVKKSRLV